MSSTAGEANKLSSYRKNKLAKNADKNAEGNPTSHATAVVARTTDRPLLTGRRNAPPGARHPAHVRAPTTSKGCVGRAASPLPPLPTLSRREMPPPCGSTRLDRKLEGSRTTPSTCFHSTSRVVNGSRRAPTTKTSPLEWLSILPATQSLPPGGRKSMAQGISRHATRTLQRTQVPRLHVAASTFSRSWASR